MESRLIFLLDEGHLISEFLQLALEIVLPLLFNLACHILLSQLMVASACGDDVVYGLED